MKKIIILSTLFIAQFLNAQIESNKVPVAVFENGTYKFIVDEIKIMRAYEKAFNLEGGTFKSVNIETYNEGSIYNIVFKGNEAGAKWNFFATLNDIGQVCVGWGDPVVNCKGVYCNGCCVTGTTCSPCAANGSANIGTCTRTNSFIIKPFKEYLDAE